MSEIQTGIPPVNKEIIFLAGEFGCRPEWYRGFCWQSSEPWQELKFYIFPETLGMPSGYPPFNSPPYLGKWYEPREIFYPDVFEE